MNRRCVTKYLERDILLFFSVSPDEHYGNISKQTMIVAS
jgi:hypothetical protein